MKSLKRFDLFSKVSPDISPNSALGGLFSLLAIAMMTGLFLGELQKYAGERMERRVKVDQDQGAKMMQVNFNVTLWKLPCAVIGLDHLDVLVDYQEGIRGSVSKRRVAKDFSHIRHSELDQFSQSEIQALFSTGEFCVLEGTFQVAKVPGYISLVPINLPSDFRPLLSFDHTINHLSFGRLHKHSYINTVFGTGPHTNFSPYDGLMHRNTTGAYSYFAKVVPITYIDENLEDIQHSYHYSMNHYNAEGSAVGFFSLKYDVETVTVTYVLRAFQWRHVAVHLCAVLGGVYVVVGLVLRAATFGK